MTSEAGVADHDTQRQDDGVASVDSLLALVASNALTTEQLALIHEMWHDDATVAWGDPRLRSVREFSRAHVDAVVEATA